MFSLKNIKGGKVAYIFDESHAEIAVNMAPLFLAELIGGKFLESKKESRETNGLQDVKKRVEAITQPQITLKIESPKPKLLSKQEISDEIARVSKRIEETFSVSRRELWYVVYEKFQQKTDINIKDVKKTSKFSRNRSASSYNTLIDDGYGFILLDIVRDYHDRLAIR
jgi:hypothetical protein